MSSVQGIDHLLGELRAAAALASGQQAPAASGAESPDFAGMLAQSISQVNQIQQQADGAQQAFQSGAEDANLQDVMVSLQKANLSFQTMVQVRNKLVSAYQEIMNLQV